MPKRRLVKLVDLNSVLYRYEPEERDFSSDWNCIHSCMCFAWVRDGRGKFGDANGNIEMKMERGDTKKGG